MAKLYQAEKIKILVMDTPIGSGHVVAAKALKIELEKQFVNSEIQHISTFDFFPKILSRLFLKLYLLSLNVSPRIYAFFYRWGNKKESTASRNSLNYLLAKFAKKQILDFSPDIVIATHATPAGIIAQLKANGYLRDCRLYGVVTDYVMHKWWYYKEVDAYFTADIELAGVNFAAKQLVYKYGIPLREEFGKVVQFSKAERQAKLNLDNDSKNYLLLGGGEGILPMQEIIMAIKSYEPKSQIVAICGYNEQLRCKINAMNLESIQSLGFVDNIQEYMAAATCIISKAGGISSTEILSQNANYIIYKPLVGQEMNNAIFLRERFGLNIANNRIELIEMLGFLKKNKMEKEFLIPSNSTEKIVQQIFNLTKKANYEYND